MTKMLIEIHDTGLVLEMDDGSKWSVNPFDASICCAWTPTNTMTIEENDEKDYSYNITDSGSGLTVRAHPYAE